MKKNILVSLVIMSLVLAMGSLVLADTDTVGQTVNIDIPNTANISTTVTAADLGFEAPEDAGGVAGDLPYGLTTGEGGYDIDASGSIEYTCVNDTGKIRKIQEPALSNFDSSSMGCCW